MYFPFNERVCQLAPTHNRVESLSLEFQGEENLIAAENI